MKKIGKILIGCLVIVLILGILTLIFGGLILKRIITGTIMQKTGVQVNINDINKGKLTYTDPKTGATLNIGENKVPDNFPKDFPIYPNSTVTSSWSANNFELTLTTKDDTSKVTSYYESNLKANGWSLQSSNAGNWVVTKNNLTGILTITNQNNLTSILIVLGQNATPSPSSQ